MSWQGYVDNLIATQTMTAVGIFGLDGNPWATSAGFPVSSIKNSLSNSFFRGF